MVVGQAWVGAGNDGGNDERNEGWWSDLVEHPRGQFGYEEMRKKKRMMEFEVVAITLKKTKRGSEITLDLLGFAP